VTEDEAKTKWCPFARIVAGHNEGGNIRVTAPQAPFNRIDVHEAPPDFFAGAKCIASACMAWRTGGPGFLVGEGGYCGLAGPL